VSIIKGIYKKIICQRTYCIMFLIVMTALTSSPLLQIYLGRFVKIGFVWGSYLVLLDFTSNRSLLKNRSSLWLLLFCASYAVSILIAAPNHLFENISQFLYMVLFIILLFGNDHNTPVEVKMKELKIVSSTYVAVTFALTMVCMLFFLFSVSFTYYHEIYGNLTVGLSYNRFWGLYNPNTGSTLAVISIFMSWMLLVMETINSRKFHISNIVFQLIYLLFTQSRTAWYTLLIFGTIMFFVQLLLWMKKKNISTIVSAIAALVIAVAITGSAEILRPVSVKTISYIPSIIRQLKNVAFDHGSFSKDDIKPAINQRDDEYDPDSNDVTNGRVQIWRAGIKTFIKNPIFGVTREGLYDQVSPHLIEERLDNLKKGGIHNIYISVLVSSGIVGFIFLVIFVFDLCRTLLFRRVLTVTRENMWQYLLMIIPFSFFLIEIFEARILYRVNIFGVVFWVFSGYLLYFSEKAIQQEGSCIQGKWIARLENRFKKRKGKNTKLLRLN